MSKKTIQDLGNLKGKRALVRVDFNVPLDAAGGVANDRRIQAALPTLRYLLDAGAAVIVMSHLGRPKGDPKKDALLRMDKVGERLSHLLGRPVKKTDAVVGPAVENAVTALRAGDVLLLENLRFHPGEQTGAADFAKSLASLADVYVNDAFGTCHREDASMVAVPRAMKDRPRVVGFLVAKELQILGQLLVSPGHPYIAVLGGAKVSDKIGFIRSLLQRVDRVLVGGAMSYTFMKSEGDSVGNSKVESDKLDVARNLLRESAGKIALPSDHLVVKRFEEPRTARIEQGSIADGWIGVDIGPKSIAEYQEGIGRAATVIWNGPMGKYEDAPYRNGTMAIAQAMANSQAVTVVGGGETADAVEEFGLAERMTHVSTGGGAFLEYVEGTPFPALAEIEDKNQK
jgi:phosphoglycerate kinase